MFRARSAAGMELLGYAAISNEDLNKTDTKFLWHTTSHPPTLPLSDGAVGVSQELLSFVCLIGADDAVLAC